MTQIAVVINLILGECVGAANAMTGAKLRARLAAAEFRIGNRSMRKIIENECPNICFNAHGYFLAASESEARACAGRIEHYIRGLAMRRRSILEPYQTDGQLSLGI